MRRDGSIATDRGGNHRERARRALFVRPRGSRSRADTSASHSSKDVHHLKQALFVFLYFSLLVLLFSNLDFSVSPNRVFRLDEGIFRVSGVATVSPRIDREINGDACDRPRIVGLALLVGISSTFVA